MVAITFLQSNDSNTLSTDLRTRYRSIIAMTVQLQLCNCPKVKEMYVKEMRPEKKEFLILSVQYILSMHALDNFFGQCPNRRV